MTSAEATPKPISEVAAREDWRADAGKRFFRRGARQSRPVERKAMIDRAHDLPYCPSEVYFVRLCIAGTA
jgi:hypothetical protein